MLFVVHLDQLRELSCPSLWPTLALDAQMQVHLLQIIREAVLNAMKHANASEIAVSCVTAPDGNQIGRAHV